MGDFPRPPTVHEQIYELQMNLAVEHSHRAALEGKLDHQTHQIESSSGQKNYKISHKAFSFKDYDGTKDARTILAWVSQLDDYFHDENLLTRTWLNVHLIISRVVLYCGGMLLNKEGIDLGFDMHFKEHLRVNFYHHITNPKLEGNGI